MTDAPSQPEAERHILGSILRRNESLDIVADLLDADDFHVGHHATLYAAMVELWRKGEPVDLVTVSDIIGAKNLAVVGGMGMLTDLFEQVPVATGLDFYANMVKDKSAQRQTIAACNEIINAAQVPATKADDLIELAESRILAVGSKRLRNTMADVPDLLSAAHERFTALSESADRITGLRTGFIDVDSKTRGLKNGNLIIIAGRPGMGKTSLAINIATNVAIKSQRPVVIFSLEMSKAELVDKMICSIAGINVNKLTCGFMSRIEGERIGAAYEQLRTAPIAIDDFGGITIEKLFSKARRVKRERGDLALVIIDYIQLMAGKVDSERRDLEVAGITRGAKMMSSELETVVIAVSQLNRGVENRQDKRPTMSDLRESGAIEQDADLIGMIYRHETYNPDAVEHQGLAELNIVKNRHGPTGKVSMQFTKETATFSDLSQREMI